MFRTTVAAAAAIAMAGLVSGSVRPVAAQPVHNNAVHQQGTTHDTARFYTGGVGHVGEFPGTIVMLGCDQLKTAGTHHECRRAGEHPALRTVDGNVYALLPGSRTVLHQIRDEAVDGQRVLVKGRFYQTTGVILVNAMAPAQH